MTVTSDFAFEAGQEQPKVLLVDDDEGNLLLTSIALRERGFAITEASSGEQALQMMSDWLPDVIGLDDDASIARAYEAGATDFFVKSTQWSMLAGRLRYLLRAARTRDELERSKTKLARAQDLARMGSFDWRKGAGDLSFSVEGLRVFGLGAHDHLGLKTILRMLPDEERRGFARILHEVVDHGTILCNDVQISLADGRRRILHVEAEPEFNELACLIGYTGIV